MNTAILSSQEDFLEYRPELGLMQFCTQQRCVAVDPQAVPSLAAWWEIMADDTTTVVVHGGQAEIRFCIQRSGLKPRKLVDIQIAEGLRGRSYPLSYSAIVERVLGKHVASDQTRTDWLRRPLSQEQIEYALDDVSHVLNVWRYQNRWLEAHQRLSWAVSEFDRMCDEILAEEQMPPWEKISGMHKLPRRELAIAQRLAQWREDEAAARNRPARRVLRDDLLIDLARRRPKTVQQALATRDLNRPEYRKRLDDIVAVIDAAIRIPDDQLPRRLRARDESSSDEQVISKLLALALANVCAELEISQMLVGTNRDLMELVRTLRHGELDGTPRLLEGWRGEICGDLLRKVLEGRVRFRVSPPRSATPLIFEDHPEDA
jgi:ribonuclease D